MVGPLGQTVKRLKHNMFGKFFGDEGKHLTVFSISKGVECSPGHGGSGVFTYSHVTLELYLIVPGSSFPNACIGRCIYLYNCE